MAWRATATDPFSNGPGSSGWKAVPTGDPWSDSEPDPNPRLLAIVHRLGAAWSLLLVALAVLAVIVVSAVWQRLMTA
jgi:hypothetical protein